MHFLCIFKNTQDYFYKLYFTPKAFKKKKIVLIALES